MYILGYVVFVLCERMSYFWFFLVDGIDERYGSYCGTPPVACSGVLCCCIETPTLRGCGLIQNYNQHKAKTWCLCDNCKWVKCKGTIFIKCTLFQNRLYLKDFYMRHLNNQFHPSQMHLQRLSCMKTLGHPFPKPMRCTMYLKQWYYLPSYT